jgi:hypothetical protein
MDPGEQQMAEKINHAFVVTSAINSKFGVYTPEQRLEQTLATIASVRSKVPGCKLILMECTGIPLTADQEAALDQAVDIMYDYTADADVQAIYQSDNWDVVKNTTEIMCFARTLSSCLADGDLHGIQRIHKMSGRYLLNDYFRPELYQEEPDKIIIGPKHNSQFPIEVTGIPLQYMARLWSWPATMTADIIQVYNDSLAYIAQRVAAGGYADIEHVLYKFLPEEFVLELPFLGVEGKIAPTGQEINN